MSTPKDNTFDAFTAELRTLLEGKATTKRYSDTGVDGDNALYEFVKDTVGGDQHACGEIIYKVRRFLATGNNEDIVKVAAWAYLIWKHRP